ncbi:class I SAM-dependent methyltransferase [Nonomuraea roseola]|uniref:Class I SAM-dependent methyltransferase n=1 Tax=Nonomuraea roseola TaxID=46179 RepID=A0ABV5PVS8_9ACTN
MTQAEEMRSLPDKLHRTFFKSMSLLPARGQGLLLRHYFEWFHRTPDPWRHAVDPYEARKYATTLAHVEGDTFDRVLDVGCSEGTFTLLAAESYPEADVLGVDVSERAVHRAASRSKARPSGRTRFAAMDFLNQDPGGRFDLVVCAETLYYVGRDDRLRLASERLRSFLAPGGTLVMVHPWPEARRLHRFVDGDPLLVRRDEQVEHDGGRPYAVSSYRLR